ncbi:uncharacterized protein LOC106645498 [Copidosoma floridanum]|uniref:uncharacterized protein LOC106645498 n=1 Tax=Copidosoma floridanum TaxID=29053 RepID=UPI0006C9DA91|nr:uncharacterized protein LOC106645498 [Copidosoma floridanum]
MPKKFSPQCRCSCLKRAVKNLSSETLAEADEDGIINVIGSNFLSERNLIRSSSLSPKLSASEPNIAYSVNYDDLCGPWPSPDNPVLEQYDDATLKPTLCTWKFITKRDAKCMREHMFDRDVIKRLIEKKLPDHVLFQGDGKEIFLSFSWEIFKYMRDNEFSGEAISSILGLFYLTHRFFLSDRWHSARETFNFFIHGVELHTRLKPPDHDLVLNFAECDKLRDMFRSVYIRKLELVRAVCLPRYNLVLKINKKCGVKQEDDTCVYNSLESRNSKQQQV